MKSLIVLLVLCSVAYSVLGAALVDRIMLAVTRQHDDAIRTVAYYMAGQDFTHVSQEVGDLAQRGDRSQNPAKFFFENKKEIEQVEAEYRKYGQGEGLEWMMAYLPLISFFLK